MPIVRPHDIGVRLAWIPFDADAPDWRALAATAAADVLSIVPDGADVVALDDRHPHPGAVHDYYLHNKKVRVMVEFDLQELKLIGRAHVAYRIS